MRALSSASDEASNVGSYPLGPVLEFLGELWALDHALQRASKAMAGELGVTAEQRMIVRIVGRYPGITPGQLARLLRVDASTLSTSLHRLLARGLIARRRDVRDRRRVTLGLTSAGHMLDVPAAPSVESAVEEVLRALPDAHVEEFKQVVRALVRAISSESAG